MKPYPPSPARRRTLAALPLALLLALTGGCASLTQRDPVRVNVVGLEPLPGQGMEIRFLLKLRVQNPNDDAIDYDGIALELEVNDRPFATGVSDARGSVPRYGDSVIELPVSVSAAALVRQALDAFDGRPAAALPYTLRGRLGGRFGGLRFSEAGSLELPASGRPRERR